MNADLKILGEMTIDSWQIITTVYFLYGQGSPNQDIRKTDREKRALGR